MLERDIESQVCKYATSKGFHHFKWVSPGKAGVCDRIFICKDRIFFIEFKQLNEKPKPHQSRHHQLLVELGHTVYVVDRVSHGKEIVDYEEEFNRPHWSAVQRTDSDS